MTTEAKMDAMRRETLPATTVVAPHVKLTKEESRACSQHLIKHIQTVFAAGGDPNHLFINDVHFVAFATLREFQQSAPMQAISECTNSDFYNELITGVDFVLEPATAAVATATAAAAATLPPPVSALTSTDDKRLHGWALIKLAGMTDERWHEVRRQVFAHLDEVKCFKFSVVKSASETAPTDVLGKIVAQVRLEMDAAESRSRIVGLLRRDRSQAFRRFKEAESAVTKAEFALKDALVVLKQELERLQRARRDVQVAKSDKRARDDQVALLEELDSDSDDN